jgi:hypothetical protein
VNRGAASVQLLVTAVRGGCDQAFGLLPSAVLAGQHSDYAGEPAGQLAHKPSKIS